MEDMQPAPLPTKKHFEIMHGVLLLITLTTMLVVLAIAYFTNGFVITFEQMREGHGLQMNALDRIEAKLSIQEEQPLAASQTQTDTVELLSDTNTFLRFTTRTACKDHFRVKYVAGFNLPPRADGLLTPGPSRPHYVVELLKSAQTTPNDLYIGARKFVILSTEDLQNTLKDGGMGEKVLRLSHQDANKYLMQYAFTHDGDPEAYINDANGEICSVEVEEIPYNG